MLVFFFFFVFFLFFFFFFCAPSKSPCSVREILPLDKWEILPEQITYQEKLGQGAFGVVYKAHLKKRNGIEVFDNRRKLKPENERQVVAVKMLRGILLNVPMVTSDWAAKTI